ncbi:hypothetical protein OQH61_02015 [Helicobacter sp. MIT 21-1697]|uniref:hypothetical protein n=1 Tax=Helicobacter sp. MIT 21-1697 TaxID=2993733 RepID=UPI00224B3C60|nr:hypothetical protein [Helicobacter sp. MIT 21-1697]MCX2716507.1 hypothetical protein [Helicobacter sp. MIT 21-1697]
MEKYIVAAKPDGFGVRLCTLLNAMYLSKKTHLSFKFRWEVPRIPHNTTLKGILTPYENIPSKENLFHPDFIANYHTTLIPSSEDMSILHHQSLSKFCSTPCTYVFGSYSVQVLLHHYWKDIDIKEYFTILKSCWESVRFTPYVERIIAKAKAKALNLGSFVAVHLRAGDVIYNLKQDIHINPYTFMKKPLSPYLALEIINEQRQAGQKVLLFSDDLPTLQAIKAQNDNYFAMNGGGAELIIADDIIETHWNNFERSFFEMILISCAKTLYSSGDSAFSRLPIMISNMPHISLYERFSLAQQYHIYQKYLQTYTFHPAQVAFAYLHLWHLAGLLHLGLEHQKHYIAKATACEYENMTYKILLCSTMLKMKKYGELEKLLSLILAQCKESFLQELTAYQTYHSFLYAFALEEYFTLTHNLSFSQIPYVTYFKYAIVSVLLELPLEQIQQIQNYKAILAFLDSQNITRFCSHTKEIESFNELTLKLQSKSFAKKVRTLKMRIHFAYIRKLCSLKYWIGRFKGLKRSLAKRGLL